MMRIRLVFISLALFLSTQLLAQPAVHHPNQDEDLSKRWDWAVSKSRDYGQGVWIGYSIKRMMGHNSHIGSFDSNRSPDERTLQSILYGRPDDPNSGLTDKERIDHAVEMALREFKDDDVVPKELKEVAILFRFDQTPARNNDVHVIKVSNINLHVKLEGMPVLWLGSSIDPQSLALLQGFYDDVSTETLRKRLIMAIGIHDEKERLIPILRRYLAEDKDYKVRRQAAFWLGQTDHKDALAVLIQAIDSDESVKVKEHCVFAISQMDLPEATDRLINLAQKFRNTKVREKAIFWLGQKASKQAEEVIQGIAFDGETTEIQKKAVFALTQLPEDRATDHLIRIAKTHNNVKVRKHAIFWLGQSEDPKALETLIEIVRKEED